MAFRLAVVRLLRMHFPDLDVGLGKLQMEVSIRNKFFYKVREEYDWVRLRAEAPENVLEFRESPDGPFGEDGIGMTSLEEAIKARDEEQFKHLVSRWGPLGLLLLTWPSRNQRSARSQLRSTPPKFIWMAQAALQPIKELLEGYWRWFGKSEKFVIHDCDWSCCSRVVQHPVCTDSVRCICRVLSVVVWQRSFKS